MIHELPSDFGDIPVRALREDADSELMKALFATEYDKTVRVLLGAMEAAGFTKEEFDDLLNDAAGILAPIGSVPDDITVRESMPYVYVSDLVTIGMLAHQLFTAQAERFQDSFVEKKDGD